MRSTQMNANASLSVIEKGKTDGDFASSMQFCVLPSTAGVRQKGSQRGGKFSDGPNVKLLRIRKS
ncbi:hypothetical protein SAMN05421753_11443 [Planctomicrobium piriforme]|uniref:Uncharacterized protein n=1 Tax=Planctomicrobium piriforme TaxID=1576369 RepID=A0A1I3MM10_9PLAN|nr:hypothetical protein SAMN05421753_11443 [Planctomicrobium piriforme]